MHELKERHSASASLDAAMAAMGLRKEARAKALARQELVISSGVDALSRLLLIAKGTSGQSRSVAAFLLGLYNGQRFPFDLTRLRGLDDAIYEDCMEVLEMDARYCVKEVHEYCENGGQVFEALARAWQFERRSR